MILIYTITKNSDNTYDIKCSNWPDYNQYNIPEASIGSSMELVSNRKDMILFKLQDVGEHHSSIIDLFEIQKHGDKTYSIVGDNEKRKNISENFLYRLMKDLTVRCDGSQVYFIVKKH